MKCENCGNKGKECFCGECAVIGNEGHNYYVGTGQQPEEKQDEIREAFEAWDNYGYVAGKFSADHVFSIRDVVYCMGISQQQAQAEIEGLKQELSNSIIGANKYRDREKQLEQSATEYPEAYQKALNKIHSELECCGNCNHSATGQAVLYKQKCIQCHYNEFSIEVKYENNWKQKRDK
jgi:hypothetical protein